MKKRINLLLPVILALFWSIYEVHGESFAQMRKEEAEPPAGKIVSPANGYFTGRIASTDEKPVVIDNKDHFVFQTSIGAPDRAHCMVFTDSKVLPMIVTGVLKNLQTKFPQSGITSYETGVLHGRPYLQTYLSYIAEQEQQSARGTLKMMMFSYPRNSVVCLHDEPGYRRTFRRVMADFIKTLRFSAPNPDPEYREISLLSLNDHRVGFMERFMYRRNDGGYVIESENSILLQKSARDRLAKYHFKREVSDAGGVVYAGQYRVLDNGEPLYNLQLEKAKDGFRYLIKGTYRGKEISSNFDFPGGLPDQRKRRLLLMEELNRKKIGESVSYQEYMPSEDPLKPVVIVLTRDTIKESDRGADMIVQARIGQLVVRTAIDKDGMDLSSSSTVGSIRISVDRVYSDGKP